MSGKLRSLVVGLFALGALSAAAAWQAEEPGDDVPDERVPSLRQAVPGYWKGNLHTHSLWSDGDDFPEMIADWYKRHGYHFLALSDHNVLSEGERWLTVAEKHRPAITKYQTRFGPSWIEQRVRAGKPEIRLKPLAEFRSMLEEPGRFLMIPAEEITHRFVKAPVHMNAINLRDVIKPIDGDGVSETILVNHRSVAEQRQRTGWQTLVFLNHPNFGWGVRVEDMVPVEELRFFEIFNGHPGVRNYGDETHPGCERMWDILLAQRLGKHRLPIVYGLATDDAHRYHKFGVGQVNPGRGWIMVRAPYLSAEAMVRAIEAGDFYSSTGVTLREVRREDDRLALVIQAEPGVKYRTEFIATLRDAPLDAEPRHDPAGKPLSGIYSPEIGQVVATSDSPEPSYRFTGKELYVRARVISTRPHPNPYQEGDVEVAWTQPVVP